MLDDLKTQVKSNAREHERYQGLDGVTYNGSTIIVLLATTTTTLLPTDHTWEVVLVKCLSALATFLIALERTLNYGERWRYHREMRHGYLGILQKLVFYENMGEGYSVDAKKEYLERVYFDLNALALREGQIPGVAKAPTTASG